MGYMYPNPRVINLHLTSYNPYPEPLSKDSLKGRFGEILGSHLNISVCILTLKDQLESFPLLGCFWEGSAAGINGYQINGLFHF